MPELTVLLHGLGGWVFPVPGGADTAAGVCIQSPPLVSCGVLQKAPSAWVSPCLKWQWSPCAPHRPAARPYVWHTARAHSVFALAFSAGLPCPSHVCVGSNESRDRNDLWGQEASRPVSRDTVDSAPGSTRAGWALWLQQLREVPGDHAQLELRLYLAKTLSRHRGQERGLWETEAQPRHRERPCP